MERLELDAKDSLSGQRVSCVNVPQNGRLMTAVSGRERLHLNNMTAPSGRKTAGKTGKPRFSRRKYAALLSETQPRVIETNAELERLTRQIESLLDKGERRTPEENVLCRLVLKLIDDYQQARHSIPDMKPHELLQALLEESGKRQADLLPVFGSRSRVSDAVNGKRSISKSQAKRLGEFFSISPASFI